MKKNNKKYPEQEHTPFEVKEPFVAYNLVKHQPIAKDFTYNDFKKIAEKTDITQKEWASVLHISERTLQRYAKDNSIFGFNLIDKIIQINKVFRRGYEVFGSYEKFTLWLRSNPSMIEEKLSLQSLASFDGINNLLVQLGRIEHGIFS